MALWARRGSAKVTSHSSGPRQPRAGWCSRPYGLNLSSSTARWIGVHLRTPEGDAVPDRAQRQHGKGCLFAQIAELECDHLVAMGRGGQSLERERVIEQLLGQREPSGLRPRPMQCHVAGCPEAVVQDVKPTEHQGVWLDVEACRLHLRVVAEEHLLVTTRALALLAPLHLEPMVVGKPHQREVVCVLFERCPGHKGALCPPFHVG